MGIRRNLPFGIALHVFIAMFLAFGFHDLAAQTKELPVSVKQTAEFKNIAILPNQIKDGLMGVAIKFDLEFEFEGKALFEKPESFRDYVVICRLTDRGGREIDASFDALHYQDLNGHFRDSLTIRLGNAGKLFKDEAMFIPYHALALDEGERQLRVDLELKTLKEEKEAKESKESKAAATIANSETGEVQFLKPPIRLVKIAVKEILADSTDLDGEPWDFKFLNPRDVGPDIFWTLRRGSHILMQSDKQKNQIAYFGAEQDISPWIQISEGDLVYLAAADFDRLGYSDQIGMLSLNPEAKEIKNHAVNTFKFDAVKQALIKVDVIAPAQTKITALEINETAKDRGVSGIGIRLNYQLATNLAGGIPVLSLDFLTKAVLESPEIVRVVAGPAVPYGPHQVELTGAEGKLELFIPHYAVPQKVKKGAHSLFLLSPGWMIDKQQIDFPSLNRQVILPADPIQDLVFGQFEFSEEKHEGASGLVVRCNYEIPAAYFEDLDAAQFFLVPQFDIGLGKPILEKFEALGSNERFWQKGRFEVIESNRKGTLALFVPNFRLPKVKDNFKLQGNFKCLFRLDDSEIGIGEKEIAPIVMVSKLKTLHFNLKETVAKKENWMITDPNLFWVLKVGNYEVFRSPVVYNRKEAKWSETVEAKILALATDEIELQVLHEGVSGEEDRVIESWKGHADLIPNKPKGVTNLHPMTLKKLVIRSSWEE